MQAAQRAARKVIEQAHRENRPIPVWNGEKVEYLIPPLPDEEDSTDSKTTTTRKASCPTKISTHLSRPRI
uniref:Uncharacterized protein n=1 Tax=Candidatus Kentrum sp. UNK TaxID=2126344 RepID=A0A451AXW9_9GAMM|nr:MAG: hypothetical protein BECKUNK1418G_GA0071005_103519 [Candidatus Kentron sp. UNK]VFK70881.1 MAG: hypothetical protein BECKUNK1418H_GA0071006_104119 [Candidatus Kentron sp. UNK]